MLERRSLVLAGLAAVPVGATGLLASTNRTEAAVMRAAERARAAVEAHRQARRAFNDAEDRFAAMPLGPCPLKPDSEAGRAAINTAMTGLLRQFLVLTPDLDKAAADLRQRTEAEMAAVHEAWMADHERLRAESGATAAEASYDQTSGAEVSAVFALAEIRATTVAGVLAKAAVFRENPHDDQLDTHQHALALSVMRDLQAMVGAEASA